MFLKGLTHIPNINFQGLLLPRFCCSQMSSEFLFDCCSQPCERPLWCDLESSRSLSMNLSPSHSGFLECWVIEERCGLCCLEMRNVLSLPRFECDLSWDDCHSYYQWASLRVQSVPALELAVSHQPLHPEGWGERCAPPCQARNAITNVIFSVCHLVDMWNLPDPFSLEDAPLPLCLLSALW